MPESIENNSNNKRTLSDENILPSYPAKKSKAHIIPQAEFKDWITVKYKDFFACSRSMALLAFYLENKLRNESDSFSKESLKNAFHALGENISSAGILYKGEYGIKFLKDKGFISKPKNNVNFELNNNFFNELENQQEPHIEVFKSTMSSDYEVDMAAWFKALKNCYDDSSYQINENVRPKIINSTKSRFLNISQEEFSDWITVKYKDFFACTRSMALLAFYVENKLRNRLDFFSQPSLEHAFSALGEKLSSDALHKTAFGFLEGHEFIKKQNRLLCFNVDFFNQLQITHESRIVIFEAGIPLRNKAPVSYEVNLNEWVSALKNCYKDNSYKLGESGRPKPITSVNNKITKDIFTNWLFHKIEYRDFFSRSRLVTLIALFSENYLRQNNEPLNIHNITDAIAWVEDKKLDQCTLTKKDKGLLTILINKYKLIESDDNQTKGYKFVKDIEKILNEIGKISVNKASSMITCTPYDVFKKMQELIKPENVNNNNQSVATNPNGFFISSPSNTKKNSEKALSKAVLSTDEGHHTETEYDIAESDSHFLNKEQLLTKVKTLEHELALARKENLELKTELDQYKQPLLARPSLF